MHDALRPAGSAAGVHDGGQVVAAALGIADRRGFGDQLLVGEHAFRRRAVADMDQQRPHLGGRGDVFGQVQETVVDQQDAGIAIVQRIDDLRHAPADVHRVEHAAAPPGGQHVFQKAVGVQGQHADAIADAHAVLLQRAGQARDPLAQFTEGVAAFAEDGGGVSGVKLQGTVQPLGQVHLAILELVLVVDDCVDRCKSAWLSYENISRNIN
ncbi:hypothetical protein D3C76_709150 [compost metagenome]